MRSPLSKPIAPVEDTPTAVEVSDARVTGLLAFHCKRKKDNRERLLAAALTQFGTRGYLSASIEDIATAAGVSRVTFYRHFNGKEALAVALFVRVAAAAVPRFARIGEVDYRDRATVRAWLDRLFEVDRENRALLTIFTQAAVEGGAFLKRGHAYLADNIRALGERIPAFALDSESPEHRRRWIEAWLLIYEIKDQSNHAALGSGVATDPLVLDVLTDRFLAFINTSPRT